MKRSAIKTEELDSMAIRSPVINRTLKSTLRSVSQLPRN